MRTLKYWQAIREAIFEEMENDDTVFIMGQGVQEGCFKVTSQLIQKFGPDRVMDTPISELATCGAAIGAAAAGFRPIVDLTFVDFIYCAADEILIKGANLSFTHAGKVNAPCVFLGFAGGGYGAGPDHSHIPSALVMNNPGVKLALPSTPYDAKGLMKTAIRDNNPVLYFFHKQLMEMEAPVPEEGYEIPFGLADIKKEGTDVTVVATCYMVHLALEAARELEGKISVEVVDPRTLEPLDIDTIIASVKKTGRAVVVDEDTERCGVGAEIMAQIMERAFDHLDAPLKRVCAANLPVAGGVLEKYCVPQPEQVLAAIESVGFYK